MSNGYEWINIPDEHKDRRAVECEKMINLGPGVVITIYQTG